VHLRLRPYETQRPGGEAQGQCWRRGAATLRAICERVRKAGTTSRFRGVSWERTCRRWRAVIRCDERTLHLGLFDEEVDAALAYDAAAVRVRGRHAKLNFPVEP
jgi:AP2 domain